MVTIRAIGEKLLEALYSELVESGLVKISNGAFSGSVSSKYAFHGLGTGQFKRPYNWRY
jgi:hypothetical protein